jgi:hypothetical protein
MVKKTFEFKEAEASVEMLLAEVVKKMNEIDVLKRRGRVYISLPNIYVYQMETGKSFSSKEVVTNYSIEIEGYDENDNVTSFKLTRNSTSYEKPTTIT